MGTGKILSVRNSVVDPFTVQILPGWIGITFYAWNGQNWLFSLFYFYDNAPSHSTFKYIKFIHTEQLCINCCILNVLKMAKNNDIWVFILKIHASIFLNIRKNDQNSKGTIFGLMPGPKQFGTTIMIKMALNGHFHWIISMQQ